MMGWGPVRIVPFEACHKMLDLSAALVVITALLAYVN